MKSVYSIDNSHTKPHVNKTHAAQYRTKQTYFNTPHAKHSQQADRAVIIPPLRTAQCTPLGFSTTYQVHMTHTRQALLYRDSRGSRRSSYTISPTAAYLASKFVAAGTAGTNSEGPALALTA